VRWGVRVKAVTTGPSGARVETEQGVFEAPLVIGAGGHRCPVARDLGEVSAREEVVAAQETETRLPAEWRARIERFMDAPELYVEPDLRGYGWFFPKGDFINVGIGITGGNDGSLPRRRDALLAMLRATGRLPEAMPLDPFKGHAYVVRRPAPASASWATRRGWPAIFPARASGPPSAAASSPPRRRSESSGGAIPSIAMRAMSWPSTGPASPAGSAGRSAGSRR
jgi:flavin-dependent dehydrogenase